MDYQKIGDADEAHFYSNEQNCCIWDSENPHDSGGIINIYFFVDEVGNAVTVNGGPERPFSVKLE